MRRARYVEIMHFKNEYCTFGVKGVYLSSNQHCYNISLNDYAKKLISANYIN